MKIGLSKSGKSFASGLVILVFLSSLANPSGALAQQTVRVSLPNEPYLAFQDSKGNAKGLYVDIIKHIAKKENWDIRYVPCTFEECIEGLDNGVIDIGLAIDPSEAMQMLLDFSAVPVFNNWAHVYGPMGSGISSIKDLDGKYVAIVRDDRHLESLSTQAVTYDVQVHPIEVDSYLEVISALEEDVVSAGVIDRANGLFIDERFSSIEKTPIMLSPVRLYFSAKKGVNGDMLLAMDRHMTELKNDVKSLYHVSLDRWFVYHPKDRLTPRIKVAVLMSLFMALYFFYRNHKLRKRIRRSSLGSDDKLPYDPLRSYRIMFSSSKNFMALIDRDLIYRDVNDMYMQSFRLDRDEIVGHPVKDIIGAEVFEEYLKEKLLMCLEGQEVNYEYWLDLPVKGRTCLDVSLYPYPHSVGRVEGIFCSSYDVTEKKEAQKKRDLNEYRLEALCELSNMSDINENDLSAISLEKAIKLTGSSIGYIGRLNEDEDLMTVYAWSTDSMKACDVRDRTHDFPIKGSGIWAESIRQRRTLIVNDYEAPNPLKNGLPEGHVSLKSFLSVPIFEENKIVMLVAVANKEKAYDESDVRQLSMMMEGIWLHLCRKKSENALRESEETYRSLVTGINNGFALHEIVLDEKGSPLDYIFLDVNEHFEEMTGLNKEDIIGRRVTEVVPSIKESGIDWIGIYGKVALSGKGTIFEYFSETLNRWYSVSAYSPKEKQVAAILSDITEHKRMQDKLLKWSNVFEHADWGIVIGSADNRTFEMMNTAYAKMHGYTVEELTGQPIIKVFAPDYRNGVPEQIRIANEKGHHYFESIHIRKDGTEFPVSMNVTAVKDDKGNVLYRAVNVQDITERKQSEKTLMESEEQFKKAFQSGSHLMGITDIETGKFMDVNDNFVKISGYSREQAIGNTSIEIGWVSRDDREALKHELKTKGCVRDMVLDLKARDGRVLTCLNSMDIITVGGKPRLLTTSEDITERKNIEDTLRLQGEILQNLAEGVMMSRTCDGIIVYATPVFERLFGYGPGELIGRHISVLNASNEKTAMDVFNEIVLILEDQVAWKGEVYNVRADGSTFWSSAHVSAFEHIEYGNVWVTVQGDITERKHMEEALRESEETARALLNAPTDTALLLDSNGRFVALNNTTTIGLNKNAEELIGEDVFGFLPPGVRAKRREAFNEVVRRGKPARFTDILGDKWLDNVLYPVLDPEGKTVRVAIISRDITEQKKAEEVREKLLLELQSALDNVKTLSGLLPVCPSCKSVKDDGGYWGKLEEYLQSHSDIKVSMDLCPDCTKSLYPEKKPSDVSITPLSKREKEVLFWVSQGKNTWDIANILGIKESTIKFHVSNILRKLDVSTRPQAVAIAMELKLLDNSGNILST